MSCYPSSSPVLEAEDLGLLESKSKRASPVPLKAPSEPLFSGPRIRSARAQAILDSPHFQRCRYIYQNQNSHFVFPSSVHTRFEHQLSVYHMIHFWLDHLFSRQPELIQTFPAAQLPLSEEKNYWQELLAIAGLVHDIGHLANSHNFDKLLFPLLFSNMEESAHWAEHEDRAVMFMKDLNESHKFQSKGVRFTDVELSIIGALIRGDANKSSELKLPLWCFDILSSKRNEIDADKLAYLSRDVQVAQFTHSINFQRIVRSSRVIQDRICFDFNAFDSVFDVFESRFRMHKSVYQHHSTIKFDYLIRDFIIALALAFKWPQIWKDFEQDRQRCEFLGSITDSAVGGYINQLSMPKQILQSLFNSEILSSKWFWFARHIAVHRILVRNTYYQTEKENVGIGTFHLHHFCYAYSSQKHNPMENVHFYSKDNPEVSFSALESPNRDIVKRAAYEEKRSIYFSPPREDEDEVLTAEEIRQMDRAIYDLCLLLK